MVLGPVYQRQSQCPVNPLRSSVQPPPIATMRYYRLWIYTCNTLLLMSVVGFSVAAARVLVFDMRRQLIPHLSLTQPGFLYAYAVLLFQSGVLQLVGCLGAQRLNERLLNVYWFLILALLVGDLVLGVFWLFRFDKILNDLKPYLKASLSIKYGVDSHFTFLWDALQSQNRCCGVHGYQDFLRPNLTNYDSGESIVLPKSCCKEVRPGVSISAAALHRNLHYLAPTTTVPPTTVAAPTAAAQQPIAPYQQPRCPPDSLPHIQSCLPHLHAWLTQTAHVLFVIGYCVIAFIKLSFLGILRYEIREMIQKIHLVQESTGSASSQTVKSDGADKLSVKNNGAIIAQQPNSKENYVSGKALKMEEGDSPAKLGGRRHLTTLITQDPGTDSDTNSHCALILCEEGIKPPNQEHNINGNNNYEMGEMGRSSRRYRHNT